MSPWTPDVWYLWSSVCISLKLKSAYVQPLRAEITIIVTKFNEEYNDICIEMTNMKSD